MEELLYPFKKYLLAECTEEYAVEETKQRASLININKSKYLPIIRAINTLSEGKNIDFCGHLRQVLSCFPGEIEVSQKNYDAVKAHALEFGFTVHADEDRYYVNIDPIMLRDFPDLSTHYTFEKRGIRKQSIGDGTLYRTFQYTHYLSLPQKFLNYLIWNMEDNETLLAVLPTGGGKSLSWEMPALSGQYNGTIIVVVPTVALACDHEKSSQEAFSACLGGSGVPRAYYSTLSEQDKQTIHEEMRSGDLPILYISPEALLNNKFKESVFSAAESGFIQMLVIDEAHLITQWGGHFRPEFQLLPAFRNQIAERSRHGIRTLLLTATLNKPETRIIKSIFAPVAGKGAFTEFRGDGLRAEIEYYLHSCSSEKERITYLKKIVCQSPRPMIIYGATLAQIDSYYSVLKNLGFQNIAKFTGETEGKKREQIIENWRENKVDIISATSAFGMGVDKADVRTVVSAYLPENISRFYQEVGRAGRDGYSALNFWLPNKHEDSRIVQDLTKSAVPTIELIAERWISLIKNPANEKITNSLVWIDLDTAPQRLKYSETGEKNRSWNKTVVMFLLRAGAIEIEDIRYGAGNEFKLLVYLKDPVKLDSAEYVIRTFGNYREEERVRIEEDENNVFSMLEHSKTRCFSYSFAEEFPLASVQCAGCPSCRNNDVVPFFSFPKIKIETTKTRIHKEIIFKSDNLFSQYVSVHDEIMLSLEQNDDMLNIYDSIARLLQKNINIFIIPEISQVEPLLNRISSVLRFGYMILTADEVDELSTEWFDGVIAIIYVGFEDQYDHLYRVSRQIKSNNSSKTIIHVVSRDIYITRQHRNLSEIVDATILYSSI